MNVLFHPDAEKEFREAIEYYESARPGLGEDFSLEVWSAIQNAASFPRLWPVLEEDVRRCLANRFPFGVLYSIEADHIFILAVMHLHRRPDYWQYRRERS